MKTDEDRLLKKGEPSRNAQRKHSITQHTKPFQKKKRAEKEARDGDPLGNGLDSQAKFWVFIFILFLVSYLFFANFIF